MKCLTLFLICSIALSTMCSEIEVSPKAHVPNTFAANRRQNNQNTRNGQTNQNQNQHTPTRRPNQQNQQGGRSSQSRGVRVGTTAVSGLNRRTSFMELPHGNG